MENSKYQLTERGEVFLNDFRRFEERYVRAQKSLESLGCERERLTRFCERSELLKSVEPIANVE